MSHKDNLKAHNHEDAIKYGRMGGQKKAANLKDLNTIKEALNWYLSSNFKPESDVESELLSTFPELTNRDAIAIMAVTEATKNGDVKAMTFIRDTLGEGPKHPSKNEEAPPFEINIRVID